MKHPPRGRQRLMKISVCVFFGPINLSGGEPITGREGKICTIFSLAKNPNQDSFMTGRGKRLFVFCMYEKKKSLFCCTVCIWLVLIPINIGHYEKEGLKTRHISIVFPSAIMIKSHEEIQTFRSFITKKGKILFNPRTKIVTYGHNIIASVKVAKSWFSVSKSSIKRRKSLE